MKEKIFFVRFLEYQTSQLKEWIRMTCVFAIADEL